MPNLPHQHNKAKKAKPYANSRTNKYRLNGSTLKNRNNRIKARDLYTCQSCGHVTQSGEVDHILPLAKGGTESDNNCQYLCVPCHKSKTLRENGCKVVVGCDHDGWPKQ